MDSARNDEELFATRGFGRPVGFGERSALLVIDLIAAFTQPSMPLGAELSAEVEHSNRLIDAFHEAGLPVVFTTTAYNDLSEAGVWALKQAGLSSLMADGPGVVLDARLRRSRADALLVKKYASAFFGTDLVTRLISVRVDTVVIAGCTTSGCVRATAVDALQHGFRAIVAKEAVGDRSSAAHAQSLFDLQAKYGDVVGVSAICEKVIRQGGPAGRGVAS
jgi:maleamate amidohydrolase